MLEKYTNLRVPQFLYIYFRFLQTFVIIFLNSLKNKTKEKLMNNKADTADRSRIK